MPESTVSGQQYISFLIRMWRESDQEEEWIAQVEYIASGETKYFSSLDEMLAYLHRRCTKDHTSSKNNGTL
jgi:hypothetical protein